MLRNGLPLLLIGLAACAKDEPSGGASDLDAGPPPVRARFDLEPGPMRFGAIPWPDDGYLDAEGRVSVRDFPSAAQPDYAESLALAMQDLDGFGTRPVVYVRFDGEIASDSLPPDPAATLLPGASVFLVDADTSSPTAFERIPVTIHYLEDRQELRIRPALPQVLEPGRRYAAVVTSRVRGLDGRRVAAAERFLRVRDLQSTLADPLDRAARARYAPVLETLAAQGVERDAIVALAVFRVQTVARDLADARVLVRSVAATPPVLTTAHTGAALDALLGTPDQGAQGLDDGGPHEHIAWMIQGHFGAPYLPASQATWHGAFERSAAGELLSKTRDEVAFTLFLPLGAVANAELPVVVVQHGLSGDRSDALPLADALAAAGYAVFAFDAPFHGLRAAGADLRNRFTGADEPDGFGDEPGDFIGAADESGSLGAFHPFYVRDAVRQGAVELMAALQLLEDGELWRLQDLDPALASVRFDGQHIGFVGTDLGAELGLLVAPLEPVVTSVVLAFAGGALVDGWFESPAVRPLGDALLARLGRDADHIDYEHDSPLLLPDLDAFRTLADRASGLASAAAFRRSPTHALLLMAVDDEVVHNRSTEVLAHALGATLVGSVPRFVPELPSEDTRPGGTVSANLALESGAVTRVLYAYDPATHEALLRVRGSRHFNPPLDPPFSPRRTPLDVDNPIASVLRQITFYFESLRACYATEPEGPVGRVSTCVPAVRLPDFAVE